MWKPLPLYLVARGDIAACIVGVSNQFLGGGHPKSWGGSELRHKMKGAKGNEFNVAL